MGDRVKMYVVVDSSEEGMHVAEFEAEDRPKTCALLRKSIAQHPDYWEIRKAYGYSSVMLKGSREDRCIGLTPEEAVSLALKNLKGKLEETQEKLESIRDDILACQNLPVARTEEE
jgi:hypothetical protein